MTRMLALVLGLIGVVASVGVALPPPPGASPLANAGRAILKLEKTEHDIGDILDDEDVDMTFGFTNAGDADLVIERVEADCGCTVPDLDKWVYAPGESGVINVKYAVVQGVYADKARKIRVISNDYRGRPREIAVLGRVRPIATLTPKVLSFKAVRKGESARTEFEVAGRAKDFEVTGVTNKKSELFDVKIVDSRPTRGKFGDILRGTNIEVTFKGSPDVMDLSDTITITTNDPRRPELTMEVVATILPDLTIRPPTARIRPQPAGGSGETKIMIRNRHAEAFKILGIETEDDSLRLEASVEPLDPQYGVGYVATITGYAGEGLEPGDAKADVIFLTDVPGEARVRVPVRMRVVLDRNASAAAPAGADGRGKSDG